MKCRNTLRSIVEYAVLPSAAAILISNASLTLAPPAAAGQLGSTLYVTGPDQNLTGTSADEAIGFSIYWPGYAMTFADVQSLTQDFTLSGTWSGGAGVDQYFISEAIFAPVTNFDENGNAVWYEGPSIHVSFDLDNIRIIETDNDEFDRLFIDSKTGLDMQGYVFDVPVGIDHLVFSGLRNLTINGNLRRTDIQTEFTSDVIVNGRDGDDNLIVPGNNNIVRGGAGNDWLNSQTMSDFEPAITAGSTYYGGAGDDNYGVFRAADRFVEYPGEGLDTLSIYAENYDLTADNMANMERVVLVNVRDEDGNFFAYNINGSDGADTITGNDADNEIDGKGAGDTLNGGVGDDTLTGDAPPEAARVRAPARAFASGPTPAAAAGGSDRLDGGPGNDTAAFSGPRTDYAVSYNASTRIITIADKVPGRDGTDTIRNVELFRFTDGTKTLNTLFDMQVDGTEGNDKIAGGIGSDKLFGFAGNDNIIGNGGNDEIDGGTGADIMSGGDGDDSYIVDNAGDKVKENARPASGTDTVYTSLPAYVMPANVENLVYTGEGSFSGKGNKSGNRMTGGPAADRLDGQKGNDVMIGLGGDDTYVVDSLADLATEEPGGGYDAVIASVTITTLSQNVETLTLSKGNINGTGNALDNLIIGSTSQNVLSGGDGADTLIGGLGNDTFYGETSATPGDDADTISYAGAKKAIVFSLANTLTAQNTGGAGTDRIYDVSSIENLTGSAFNDTLTGSASGNVLSGTDGNDTLLGLAGADVLVGGRGLDLIDAGADADVDRVTYLAPADSPPGATFRDQVSGFAPGTDLIDLSSIDANTAVDGDQAFAFNGTTPAANAVWYAVLGPDIVLGGDVNGDAIPDFEVLMKGVQSLQGSDLVP